MTRPGAKNDIHTRRWPRFFRGSAVVSGKKGAGAGVCAGARASVGAGVGVGSSAGSSADSSAGAGWSKGDELDSSRSTVSTCKEVDDADVHPRITPVEASASDTEDLLSRSTNQDEVDLIAGDEDIPMFIKVSNPEKEAATVAVASPAAFTVGSSMSLQATTARRLDALRIQQQLQGANHPDVLFASKYLGYAHRRRAELQHATTAKPVEAVLRAECYGETGTAGRNSRVATAQQRVTCQKLSPQWY